jgi:LysR family glycine cleavage system transcriptional activator
VHDAFEHLRSATARLRGGDGRRVLRLSTTPSFATTWLVPRLAAFQAEHPEIDVEVSTSMALVDFRREEVDMAIRYGRGSWPGLRATWLLSDDIFPVCSPALAAALRTPADLARQRLIAISTYRDMWQRWLTAAGLPTSLAEHATVFDMPILAIQAAVGGMGVALVQGPLVEAELAAGRLVVPFGMQLPSEMGFYVVAPEPTADRAEIALLRAWLLQHAHA